MKNKITVAIGACSIYGIYIFLGLCFCEDFSEYVIIGSFIYFGILILNFYFIHWKDSFIADFIIEKKLNFLFIVFKISYSGRKINKNKKKRTPWQPRCALIFQKIPVRKISIPMAMRITPPRIPDLPASLVPACFPMKMPPRQMAKVTAAMMVAARRAAYHS